MKNIINSLLFILTSAIMISCQKDYGNLNGPTAENFLSDPTAGNLNNLVTGIESGMRNNMGLYLDDVGTIGRENYRFSPSEPRYITDLLGADSSQLTNSNFYITNTWASRYRVVKNCNLLLEATPNAKLVSASDKAGYIGFAETIKAYQLLLCLNQTDSNGIRLDVSNPDALGPVYPGVQALDSIQDMLELGKNALAGGTVSFPLSSGFNGFNDAAGLLQFNRALAARVMVYRQQWSDALDALGESFYGLNKDLYMGVYSVFRNTDQAIRQTPHLFPKNKPGKCVWPTLPMHRTSFPVTTGFPKRH